MKKKICLILFCLLTLYAPAELTRYILAYQNFYGYAAAFKFEIWFIWINYALMVSLFNVILFTRWEDE